MKAAKPGDVEDLIGVGVPLETYPTDASEAQTISKLGSITTGDVFDFGRALKNQEVTIDNFFPATPGGLSDPGY